MRSGRFAANHCMRRLKLGNRSISFVSPVTTAESGISPTAERIRMGSCEPSGRRIAS